MAKGTKHVFVVLGIGLVAMIAYSAVSSKVKQSSKPATGPRTGTPPAGADVHDWLSAEQVITESLGKNPEPELYTDVWVGGSGWTMEVVRASTRGGELTLDMYQTHTAIMGNGYWVTAIVPNPPDGLGERDLATVRGRIRIAERMMSGPIPEARIILDPAEVVTFQDTGK